MKQQVKRVTLAGTGFQGIAFDRLSGEYMVKNFSNSEIYVSFDAEATEANSVKIPSNFYQVVVSNEAFGGPSKFKTKTLYVKGTGEVEVQQICYQ